MPKANKMDVVREIIDKHGKDTKPLEIVGFAKKEHGTELGISTASNYKSAVIKEMGGGGKPKGKRGPKPGGFAEWKKTVSEREH